MCDEHPSVTRESQQRARKAYRCAECGLPIHVGCLYVYMFGVWDGRASSHRHHVECHKLLVEHADEDGCWIYGSLAEAIRGDPPACERWAAAKAKYASPEAV